MTSWMPLKMMELAAQTAVTHGAPLAKREVCVHRVIAILLLPFSGAHLSSAAARSSSYFRSAREPQTGQQTCHGPVHNHDPLKPQPCGIIIEVDVVGPGDHPVGVSPRVAALLFELRLR